MLGIVLLSSSVFAKGPFEGQWESNFGVLNLKQEATTVTGIYSCCNGTIKGTATESHLEFNWQDPVYGTGWGTFTLSSDGKRLEGIWGYGDRDERRPHGQWQAIRFSEPHMQGVPSYWTVSGVNAQAGSLNGSAELFFNADKVTGKIEGWYSVPIQGREMEIDVFNYLDGYVEEKSLRLQWRNPVDGSAGKMNLMRYNDRLEGNWESGDAKSRGTISFVRKAEAGAKDDVSLPSVLDRKEKLQRAEMLLHSAAESGTHNEAIQKYREAAQLFEEAGDWNKVGYALYGWATDEAAYGNYDEALRLYRKVIDLGNMVDPNIRQLAEIGREIASTQKQRKE